MRVVGGLDGLAHVPLFALAIGRSSRCVHPLGLSCPRVSRPFVGLGGVALVVLVFGSSRSGAYVCLELATGFQLGVTRLHYAVLPPPVAGSLCGGMRSLAFLVVR